MMRFFSQALKWVLPVLVVLPVIGCSEQEGGGSELIPTIYYKPTIYRERMSCSANSMKEMLDLQGARLTTLCETEFNRCLMQGSCFVSNREKVRSFNYHSTKNGIPRFVEVQLADCPFGFGVQNTCLDPYFSVAADLSLYQLGDVIFVPRLVGVTMPNGEVHEGFLIIRDAGGAIKGAGRFDFFTGFFNHLDARNTLARLGFGDSNHRYEFRMATPEEAERVRQSRAFPRIRSDLKPSLVNQVSLHDIKSPE